MIGMAIRAQRGLIELDNQIENPIRVKKPRYIKIAPINLIFISIPLSESYQFC